MNDDALSQIEHEIEKLRQERSKDEANRTEIDASITGLQWLRDKVINSSGSQLLMGIGGQGERVDVQAMRAKWEKHKMYRAVPEGAHATLHILARGAQYTSRDCAWITRTHCNSHLYMRSPKPVSLPSPFFNLLDVGVDISTWSPFRQASQEPFN